MKSSKDLAAELGVSMGTVARIAKKAGIPKRWANSFVFDAQEEQEIRRLPNGDYLVVGKTAVEDVNELLDIRIPDDDWDTLAGFVFNSLEHVPAPGEFVDHDGWRFAAESIEGRRIAVVRVSAVPPAE